MVRKTATKIDPVAVTATALKQIKCASDYHQIGNTNPNETLTAAWNTLSEPDQQRITDIINNDTPATPQAIALELAASGSKIQLESVKSHYGELSIRQAWRLLEPSGRIRIKALCDNGEKEELAPVTEQAVPYNTQPEHLDASLTPLHYPENVAKATAFMERQGLVDPQPQPRRSLFNISSDLERLNDILDDCGDDTEQQQLINDWFESLGEERDRKLDNYSALIVEMTSRAAARKAEAQRLLELAATDENRAKLLRERLKCFFQLHDLKTIETPRYKLSLAKNGGKAPLIGVATEYV